jgi:hypothetical protein
MASKTDPQRMMAGGMQLLPPTDKTADGYSVLLENFRVDQLDKLMTRGGSNLDVGPLGAGTFHTLKRSENQRFLGIGTSLWHNSFGNPGGTEIVTGLDGKPLGLAFYRGAAWLMNKSKQKKITNFGSTVVPWCPSTPTAAPVATGGGQNTTLISEFDGDQANISVGVDSPPAGDQPFTDFAMQNSAPVSNGTVTADFDTDNKQSGTGSLRLVVGGATSVTAFVTVDTFDGSVDGQVLDTDLLRIWVFCSNPAAIDSLTVYVKTGALGTANEGYVEYTFQQPAKFLNQALNSWTQLKIRRAINIDDWSQRIATAVTAGDQNTVSDLESQFATALQLPTFLYTGSAWPQTGIGGQPPATYPPSQQMLRVNWLNMTEVGVTFQINSGCNVGLDLVEIAGTVGENSNGAIQYAVSFENTDGEDGPPGPFSNSVIAGTETITLTEVPLSPDPNTGARRIWRIGGGLSSALLVGKVAGNTSTGPWVDLTTNRQAQADNVVLPVTRSAPPAAKGVFGPFFGKLIAFNVEFHPARYFWTDAGVPWSFPGATDDFEGNWEDAGSDDDEILTATNHKRLALLYKRRSIWQLPGDPATSDPIQTNSAVGALGENAVVNAGSIDYFVGWEGVYSFNGDYETKISSAIDPIFKGDFVQIADGEFLPPMAFEAAAVANVSIAVKGDRLRVSYPEQGKTLPNVVAVYHIPTQRWAREVYPNLAAPAFTCMQYEGPGFQLMAGATGSGAGGGSLYALELQGYYLDNGQSAPARWQSKSYDQGLPNIRKVYTDIEIDCQTSQGNSPNATLAVYLVTDNGTKHNLGTVSGGGGFAKPRFTAMLPVNPGGAADGDDPGIKAKNAAVRIETDYTGTVIIYGVYLHWYPEERVAASFDSGPTNLGIPERVKEVDYVELYMTGSGQALRRVISSDLPGSLLVHRDDQNLTAPNGRGNVRFRLGSQVDGRNWRFWVANTPAGGLFQVHQARVRMRPIGEYIDGTLSPSEYFESAEFSVAPGRVGELKDILLDYDTTGGDGQLVIYSDLPGNQLQIVRTLTLPGQSRAPRVLPFEIPTLSGPGGPTTDLPYGQLFKIRIYPPAGGVLRLHGRATIRARMIGVYFDGTRGEIFDTQPLDLLGGMAVFREIAIVSQQKGPMTLEFRTELPDQNMRTVGSFTVNPAATTTGRLPFIGRLPGYAKGRLQEVRLVGPYEARLFEVKVLARRVQTTDTDWSWVPVPCEPTPDAWNEVQMPVNATPEAFNWIDLPVDAIE